MQKNIVKLFSFVFIVLLTSCLITSCGVQKVTYEFYYDDIFHALNDVGNQAVGKKSVNQHDNNKIAVLKQSNDVKITLLSDITTNDTLMLKNATLDLNGHVLTMKNDAKLIVDGDSIIVGEIKGSEMISTSDNATLITIRRNSNCSVYSGQFNVNSNNGHLVAFHVYGSLKLYNSRVCVNGNHTIEDSSSVYGIYGNLFSTVAIAHSTIEAYTKDGSAYGVFNGDKCEISYSNITAFSNYMSNETDFVNCAIGCYSDGDLTLTNCNISGIHSGVNSCGSLEVDGGTYSGYGHGGFYFAGNGKTSYVYNSTIKEMDMPEGYVTHGPISTNSGFYIGGQKNNNNLVVHMDSCDIQGSKYAFVLRGTSGEQNNSLYIRRSKINKSLIRIDNNTHKLYIGENCNFDANNTNLPEAVFFMGNNG